MNQRLHSKIESSFNALFFAIASRRRPLLLLVLIAAFSIVASAQSWSSFLDSSRAVDWTTAGFSIPNYTTNCAVQPTLSSGSGAASANSTAIQNALNSCDATHNVVKLPAGTWYISGVQFGSQGHQVLRGAGADATTLVITGPTGCDGEWAGLCLKAGQATYASSPQVLPGGPQQCSWTAGYAKGTTTLTLSSCGGAPPANSLIILDQANDTSDNGGLYVCNADISGCSYNNGGGGNGRIINGVVHSQQQVVYTSSVTPLGGGSYSVTISPGVYFTNIRSGAAPGAWWGGMTTNLGVENLKVDGTSNGGYYNISMYECYQCWVKGVATSFGPRGHISMYQGLNDVIRDSYFYQAQNTGSQSYGIEIKESSAYLIENNIFQQTTAPIMSGQGSGGVIGYNFTIDNQFYNNFNNPMYSGHEAGAEMNLFEGNSTQGIFADDAWGASNQQTNFRNMLIGWGMGLTNSTFTVMNRARVRNFNFVGNVLGQPGYHTNYQSYATSATGGVNQSLENKSIYSLGWSSDTSVDPHDGKTFTTMMRWGNYDTVNSATRWDATEASPAAVAYVGSNFSSSYFSTLAHTLPASLYYSSTPSWWPSGKNWPAIGPDVTSGNVGTCTGTYSGAQATSGSQCSGGTLNLAWASHVTSIPAQDCFLGPMGGRPDGSGGILSFNASACYSSSGTTSSGTPASPTGLTAIVN